MLPVLFATEGSYTKNTDDEAQMFVANLDRFTREDDLFAPPQARVKAKLEARKKSTPLQAPIDFKVQIPDLMKDWNVLACAPILALHEERYYNPVESYRWEDKRNLIAINYSFYSLNDPSNKRSVAKQHGHVVKQVGTEWELNPKVGMYLPLRLTFLILAAGPDFSWVLVGTPNRSTFGSAVTEKRPMPKEPEPWPGNTPTRNVPASLAVPTDQQDTTLFLAGVKKVS